MNRSLVVQWTGPHFYVLLLFSVALQLYFPETHKQYKFSCTLSHVTYGMSHVGCAIGEIYHSLFLCCKKNRGWRDTDKLRLLLSKIWFFQVFTITSSNQDPGSRGNGWMKYEIYIYNMFQWEENKISLQEFQYFNQI